MPRALRTCAVLAIAVGCLGCGGKVPPTQFYVLDVAAPSPAADRLGHTAVLMPVRARRVIAQGRVVYRESSEEVGFYEYHRWAEDPEDTVADSFRREAMARGSFQSIVPFDGRTTADFVLRGELLRLEEIDYSGPVRAEAEISLELVDVPTGRVVWASTASNSENVGASDVRSVVSGMSAAARRCIEQLADQLDRHMRTLD